MHNMHVNVGGKKETIHCYTEYGILVKHCRAPERPIAHLRYLLDRGRRQCSCGSRRAGCREAR
eukprot:1776988-Heterocapsa_arctica.AAC.1